MDDSIQFLEIFGWHKNGCQGKVDRIRAIRLHPPKSRASNPERCKQASYVIAPDGKVIHGFSGLSPDKHMADTLAAGRKWWWKSAASGLPAGQPGRRAMTVSKTLRVSLGAAKVSWEATRMSQPASAASMAPWGNRW